MNMEQEKEMVEFIGTLTEGQEIIAVTVDENTKPFIDQIENYNAVSVTMGDLFTTLYTAYNLLKTKEEKDFWAEGRLIMIQGDAKEVQ